MFALNPNAKDFIPTDHLNDFAIVPSFGNLCQNVLKASYNNTLSESYYLFIENCVSACFAFSVIISILLSYSLSYNDCMLENDPYLCLKSS